MRAKVFVSLMKGLLITGAFLIGILGNVANLRAQSATTGDLTGTAMDQTGAAIPGLTVTISNVATGQTQTTTTNGSGLYEFSLLAPGTYETQFSARGFKTALANSVVVNVSEVRVVNAKLEAGAADDRVICVCEVTVGKSSSGTLVDSKTITAVPLTTRNFTQMLSMSAGSAANVNNAGLLGAGSQGATVNGNTGGGSYTIEGAASAGTVPNPDAISEFKIQTSQYDAGYGAKVPNTNLLTRSGANEFHGDAWEFVRNDVFNANAFFLNMAGQPKPNLKQNQFGATLGGPFKKDQLFFFGSYQGTRQVNGLDPSSLATTYLPPLTADRSAATLASQFCPGNHILTSGANAGQPDPKYATFAGGTQLACDGSNINPVAVKVLQLKLPDGNYAIPTPQMILPSGVGQSSYSLPSTYNENQYLGNIDYVISSRHTFSGRFFFSTTNTLRMLGANFLISAATPNLPGFPQSQKGTDYITSLKLTSVLTSKLANELRVAFTRNDASMDGRNTPMAASVGMTPADPFLPSLPEIVIDGSLGSFRLGNYKNEQGNYTKAYSVADNLSWVRGRHSVRTGFIISRQHADIFDTGPARGKITFQNFTDFLLGMSAAQNGSPKGYSNIQSILAYEGSGPGGQTIYSNRTNSGSIFVQDDVKLRPRLTVNVGLRWEYLPPSPDPSGNRGNAWISLLQLMPIPPATGTYIGTTVAAAYDPRQINPYTGQPFGPLPPAVFVRPNNSLYENGGGLDSFAPRVSFAWEPGHQQSRLAVRGGYGWFYQSAADKGNAGGTGFADNQPFSQLFANTGASNSSSTLQKPFPTATLGFVARSPTSRLTERSYGSEYKIARVQQWNLNAQYKLSSTLALDMGYVGSYGKNLLLVRGANQPLLATPGHPVNCGLPNTPTGLGVDATAFAKLGIDASGCVTTNTSGNAYLRVPFVGETPTGLQAHQYLGASWYHSMQATLRKQISRGLSFQAAYTFSKAMSNTTVYNDQTNLDLDWARTSGDRTHRLISNFGYDLPALRAPGLLGTLLKGWSMSGIVIVQSGLPMTLTDRSGGSVYGFAGSATITVCPGQTYANLVTSGNTGSRLTNWINKSAICPSAAIGSDGSTGYGNAAQGILNGPGQFNTDFSIGRTTTVGGIREDAQLALRIEFYNALNHPQFSNPGTTFGTANFGVVTQTSVAPRLIQFGVKYLF